MRVNKKGALELSINAIVIIVLALTLLGLGLTFIRNQMGDIGKTSTMVNDQIRDQILEDLRTSDKRLSFPTPEIKTSSKATELISIGVKNLLDTPLTFKIIVQDLNFKEDGTAFNCGTGTDHLYSPKTTPGDECAAFYWDTSNQKLSNGQSSVYGIKLFAPKNFNTYLYKIVIIDPTISDPAKAEYASKTFFVQVT